jgi:hypothetical protein
VAGILFYLIVLSWIAEINARFRLPTMPFLLLYSGFGLSALFGEVERPALHQNESRPGLRCLELNNETIAE